MGLFKKKIVTKTYDKENKKPVIKASICNGEQVVGFKDIHTGKIEEVILIKNQADLDAFKKMYGIDSEIDKDVIVEEDARIGANVTILCGVTIGRGSIIGAGSVIRKNTPPYSIVIGNPARVIKFVLSPEDIAEHELNLYPETERLSLDILKKHQETYIGKTL